jgi:ABC-type branched-subunit amino acid transport system ATPase component/sugar phosphate permease
LTDRIEQGNSLAGTDRGAALALDTVGDDASPGNDELPRSALSPERTPRPTFQLTRRLVAHSRWPLILLTAVYAINGSDQYLLPTVFPLLKQEFGLSDTALGVLSSSYLAIVTLLTVPFGTIADRFTRTRIIAWGTAAWGATMIWTGFARSYPSLVASRMALGAWDPCDNPTSQSLLADYYPRSQRSKVMSVYQTGQLIGVLLIPVAAAMATRWGWRSAFFFFSLPAFVVAILAWHLPEPVRGEQDRREANLDGETRVPSPFDTMGAKQAYRRILSTPTFTASMISSALGSLFFGSVGTWAPTFFVRYHDLTVSQAATAISLLALGGLTGALLSGYIADRLTYSGHRSARILVAAVSRILTFPLFYLAFTTSNTPLMLVFFTVAALTLIAPQAVLNAARADVLHPSLRGRGTALDTVMQSVFAAGAPVLLGVLADATTLRTGFLVLAPLSGLAGLILLVFGLPAYVRDERKVREVLVEEAAAVDPTGVAVRLAEAGDETRRRDDRYLLEVEGVSFSYGSIRVLFDTTMRIPRGGCHALIGRNGVGKSTLLNNVAGVLEPEAGRILYDGIDLTGVPPEQRVKLGITLMAGGRSTFPSLSVHDNLWIGSYPFADDHRLQADRLDAVLEVFPQLKSRLHQTGGTLSGGEQQMMALGRALMAGPQLLLVDELSLGLAPVVTRSLLEVVARISDLGTTVVIVEQSVPVAMEVADTVFFMERGAVEDLGPAADLREEQLVRMMMSGSPR